ncbi:MAG: acyltransferase [Gammaproteobacteria bacterium]|nr:MAG: acyltransferase [Gammaproteobacteria bacterium]
MQYRREVDGLRAVAIVPVILFHAGAIGFGGGYIGVDIFFVISGYLITSIIIEELKNNDFSIVRFYERRARRILPALSVVLAATTLTSLTLVPPNLFKDYSQSLISVATFSSNIFFYMKSGYFDTATDEKPLLHTWSLAVEEQYYIFFPVMLAVLWFIGRRSLTTLIGLLLIASLILAHYLSVNEHTNANFYLIFSRAWELFCGSLIAFINREKLQRSAIAKEAASIIGISMIIAAIVFYNKETPFPGIFAIPPVLGSALIITFCDGNCSIGRILSNRIFVFIGLISYSLYLWHQPLFALLRLKTIGEPSQILFATAIAITGILAYLNYKFIETPFRDRDAIPAKKIFIYSAISLAAILTTGVSGHLFNGFPNRFPKSPITANIQHSPKRETCHTKGKKYLKPDAACRYFGNNISWAGFGDSHIIEPTFALAKKLRKDNKGVIHLTFSGCSPELFLNKDNSGCSAWLNESVQFLEKNKEIQNILLGFRHTFYLEHITADKRENYWSSFYSIIERLQKSGKTIYLLYPIPELPIDIYKATAPFSIFSSKTTIDLKKSISIDDYLKRNRFILNKMDSLKPSNNLHKIQPLKIFCNESFCPAAINNKALYFDDNHLSIIGAEILINQNYLTTNL